MENSITSQEINSATTIAEIIKHIIKADNVIDLNPSTTFWRIEYTSSIPSGSNERLCFWKVKSLNIARLIVDECVKEGVKFSKEFQLASEKFTDDNYGQMYVKLYYVGNSNS